MVKREDDILDDILCGGNEQTTESTKKLSTVCTIKDSEPAPLQRLSKRTTVMNCGELVIVEDPVRFRKDLEGLVMFSMTRKQLSEVEEADLQKNGTMIELATIKQMKLAVEGDQKAYQYMVDRMLGKPVSQNKSVNMNITYEQFIDGLNPDENITPDTPFLDGQVVG